MAKLPVPFSFDWNHGNIEKNWNKHNVTNKEAEEIFNSKTVKIFEDEKHTTEKEERFLAYGITNLDRELTVVFTVRNEKIRIISARDMHKKEREVYEKNI